MFSLAQRVSGITRLRGFLHGNTDSIDVVLRITTRILRTSRLVRATLPSLRLSTSTAHPHPHSSIFLKLHGSSITLPAVDVSLFRITPAPPAGCSLDSAACPVAASCPALAPTSSIQTGLVPDLWYGQTLTVVA
ncbi:hypothetical protein PIB30_033182 [Stylosanthes scabra]|uniref:Uncharacterized protein n=1 Tax=Stylosanthes scabra TaxID=79078 RepID=A0ABU6QCW8_9FABA|nr:hypothetical protein [Stylosanthes scabra]